MSHISQLLYAFGKPSSTAAIRNSPEDFNVKEHLSFELDGSGQHVYLCLEKRGINTNDMAQSLARFAGVKSVAIGYAGLKDKNAVTSQWFSVDLAGRAEPNWNELESESLKIIEATRHSRKLKRGAIAENSFQIVLRDLEGGTSEIQQRLETIKKLGVPNYFGEQRFGRNDYNLKKAEDLLRENRKIKRHMRGIYLSAVRSFLFNQYLSQRISQCTWNNALDGDVFMLEGSHSIFSPVELDKEIHKRVELADIHPTGPMWGRGDLLTQRGVLDIEKQLMTDYPQWCSLLENAGLKQERRSLRVKIRDLVSIMDVESITLGFKLPPGCYATSVIRELVSYKS